MGSCELLISQSLHRIDRRRPAGRNESCHGAGQSQEYRDPSKDQRIVRTTFGPLRQNPTKQETQKNSTRKATNHAARRRAKHNPKHVPARAAQCHANAKLIGSPSHTVGNHAEQPGCGQRQCNERERAEQRRHETSIGIFILTLNPLFQVARLAKYLLIAIDGFHFGAYAIQDRQRRATGADKDLGPHLHTQRKRDIDRRLDCRLEDVRKIAPHAKTYLDYRRLLDDRDIDAVLIATPQHLHAEHFTASLASGKHVYQEKTMAFTVDHAKRMRAAFQHDDGRHTVQIGHQWTSTGAIGDAIKFNTPELMGKITAIHGHMYRNTPHGKPQWSRPIYPDMTPENIIWKSFLGDSRPVDFDANRYINWRLFWDYS